MHVDVFSDAGTIEHKMVSSAVVFFPNTDEHLLVSFPKISAKTKNTTLLEILGVYNAIVHVKLNHSDVTSITMFCDNKAVMDVLSKTASFKESINIRAINAIISFCKTNHITLTCHHASEDVRSEIRMCDWLCNLTKRNMLQSITRLSAPRKCSRYVHCPVVTGKHVSVKKSFVDSEE